MKNFWGNQTILMKMLRPIIAIMLLQALLFVGVLMHLVILPEARNDAYTVLNEQVMSRAHYLEGTMCYRWSNIDSLSDWVFHHIEEILEDEDIDFDGFLTNIAFKNEFFKQIIDDMAYALDKTEATGTFLILTEDFEAGGQGIYLRSEDPLGYFGVKQAPALFRGSLDLMDILKIEADINWSSDIMFGDIYSDDELKVLRSGSSGHWSGLKRLKGIDGECVTYSSPLINEEGRFIGVIGVDVSEAYLKQQLIYEEIGHQLTGIYMLGIVGEKDNEITIVCSNGLSEEVERLNEDAVILTDTKFEHIYKIESKNRIIYGSVQRLDLNSTGDDSGAIEWVLIGMQEESDLLHFFYRLIELADLWIMISLAIGFIGVYFVSRQFSRSLGGVIQNIHELDPNQKIKLTKIGIDEVDELIRCIEYLSNEVSEASARISKIIDITNVPIGIFEYSEDDTEVLCSRKLFSIMGWSFENEAESYVSREFFMAEMKKNEKSIIAGDWKDRTYKFTTESGYQWVQVILLEGNKKILGLVIDITKEIEEKERIEYERDYDILTDVYNRRAFQNHLDELFLTPLQLKAGALIMCDLDNLKYVNDTYGHEYGDKYISTFCQSLKEFEYYEGIIGRRSGDEFMVFLYGFDNKEELLRIITEIWERIKSRSILLPNGNAYTVKASGGIAWYPDNSVRWTALLQYADFAMYEVKHSIKGDIREFSMEEYVNNAYLLTGHEALNRLLDKQEILYAFQPIVDVEHESIFGYEMLMRSLIPELSTPREIISMARSQSKLYQLERITWFKGMETFVGKINRGLIPASQMVFINSIGSHTLNEEDIQEFVQKFKQYLGNIVIELTESEPTGEAQTQFKMHLVDEWGSMLAIDDYGTGYNNSSLLLTVDPHIIKIDMSIIRNIHKDRKRQEILETMIEYAAERNIKILGEGVETKEEMEYLVRHGVSYLQGFYISIPNLDIEPISNKIFTEIHQMKTEKKRIRL